MEVNVVTTPVKLRPMDIAATPHQPDQPNEIEGHGEADLMDSFSAMKVTQGIMYKRTADTMTIEGTPVNISRFKRQDINPTPIKLEGSSFYSESVHQFKIPPSLPEEKSLEEEVKLLVICSASQEHNTGDHQENALRTALLCGDEGCLRRPELRNRIKWIDSDNLTGAPLVDLLRVHEYTYLRYIEEKCKAASITKDEKTKKGAPAQELPPFYAPVGMLDSDTPLQAQSLEAAKRFCGAAILAVDHVMAGRSGSSTTREAPLRETITGEGAHTCGRAFVIGRPPGHHAGPHGCVPSPYFWLRPDMASSGFCLLNTVAVAAAYARHQYGRWAWRNETLAAIPVTSSSSSSSSATTTAANSDTKKQGKWRAPRIAIIDIDIHHGNGTEEIVRNLTPHQTYLPLPSSWAPVSTLSYKPWLNEQDSEEVFFSSVHLYAGERFYPCSGPDSFPTPSPDSPPATSAEAAAAPGAGSDRIVNIALTPIGPGPWDRKARAKLTPAQRDLLCKQASAEFRSKVTSMLLPRLEKFNADLIFISAGFDAHYDDFYHFLTEHDLHWVTEQLCAVADRSGTFGSGDSSCGDQTQQQQGSSGGGPRRCGVISVLEGGYSLSSPLPKAKATRAVAVASTTSSAAPTAAPASVATGAMGGVATGGPASAAAQPVVESSLFSLDTTSAVAATSSAGGASAGMVTSPSGTDSVGSVLGRGGRLKAKKEKAATGAPRLVTYATVVSGPAVSGSTVAAEAVSSGPGTSVVSPGLKGPAVVAGPSVGAKALFPPGPVAAAHGADNSSPAGATMNTMFAQRPGDGGLVKGVLAHTAALVGCKSWNRK